MNYKCAVVLMVMLLAGCPKGPCAEEDRDGILEKVRGESALKIKTFKFRDVNYENGIVCVLEIEYEAIECTNGLSGESSIVLKPRVCCCKWKQHLDPAHPLFKQYFKGWDAVLNLQRSIQFDVYRKFKKNETDILLRVPDNMSYTEVGAILDFMKQNGVAIEKAHRIEKKDGVVDFKTLDVFVNPLNARGEFFEVQLDEKGVPVKIIKKGNWIA